MSAITASLEEMTEEDTLLEIAADETEDEKATEETERALDDSADDDAFIEAATDEVTEEDEAMTEGRQRPEQSAPPFIGSQESVVSSTHVYPGEHSSAAIPPQY